MSSLTTVRIVMALLLVVTAIRKLSHREDVVESYMRVGVPERALTPLAILLIGAAGGLLAGLWSPLLGLITSVGLACYFAVAIVIHVRAGDFRNLPTPLVYEAFAITLVVLHLTGTR